LQQGRPKAAREPLVRDRSGAWARAGEGEAMNELLSRWAFRVGDRRDGRQALVLKHPDLVGCGGLA